MDKYEIKEQVGKGSFGNAFLAIHKESNEKFVMKKVRLARQTEAQRRASFREMEIVQRLQHPYIVTCHDAWVERGHTICVVYGYCEAGDLTSYIARKAKAKSPLSEELLRKWYCQMVLGLEYLHANNILHRDLKSSNIFLTSQGDIQIGDFGLAKVLGDGEVATSVVGTPNYMCPELFTDQAYDFKSDMWSLGCILFELTAFKPAFSAFNMQGLVQKIKKVKVPALPGGYTAEWSSTVKGLLKRVAEERPSAAELKEAPAMRHSFHTAQLRAEKLSRMCGRFEPIVSEPVKAESSPERPRTVACPERPRMQPSSTQHNQANPNQNQNQNQIQGGGLGGLSGQPRFIRSNFEPTGGIGGNNNKAGLQSPSNLNNRRSLDSKPRRASDHLLESDPKLQPSSASAEGIVGNPKPVKSAPEADTAPVSYIPTTIKKKTAAFKQSEMMKNNPLAQHLLRKPQPLQQPAHAPKPPSQHRSGAGAGGGGLGSEAELGGEPAGDQGGLLGRLRINGGHGTGAPRVNMLSQHTAYLTSDPLPARGSPPSPSLFNRPTTPMEAKPTGPSVLSMERCATTGNVKENGVPVDQWGFAPPPAHASDSAPPALSSASVWDRNRRFQTQPDTSDGEVGASGAVDTGLPRDQLLSTLALCAKLCHTKRLSELQQILDNFIPREGPQVQALLHAAAKPSPFQLGDKVVVGQTRKLEGVIRYFGDVVFSPGQWVGIELERPEGKNDGCVQGLKYFSCAPGCGIFVKASILQPESDTAQDRLSEHQQASSGSQAWSSRPNTSNGAQ